ncbi:unnamed protein product [Eruca vesicaria subsp. sativa]|uniref:Uncharacterized protein n=1 Tax=Eruca vesicaria subsp. sativa TaxID=29727 RepID=A0ABC8KPD5_ERUVS|nr:unnamed protein product [Eruca vesicaria subsp. sativa]
MFSRKRSSRKTAAHPGILLRWRSLFRKLTSRLVQTIRTSIEFSVDDSVLPGWDPNLAFRDGGGLSDFPLPGFDRFFSNFPADLDPPPPVEEWRGLKQSRKDPVG